MIRTTADISDLIGAAYYSEGPIERAKSDFSPDFWTLKSGLLGELAQKLVNYNLTLHLSGDFTEELANSSALRDYFRESKGSGPIQLNNIDIASNIR